MTGERERLIECRTVLFLVLATIWLRPVAAQTFTLSGQNVSTNVLSPVPFDGTLKIDYNFYTIPDTLDVYYEGTDIFSSGRVAGTGEFLVPFGPGTSSDITLILNRDGLSTGLPSNWDLVATVVPEPGCVAFISLGLLLFRARTTRAPCIG